MDAVVIDSLRAHYRVPPSEEPPSQARLDALLRRGLEAHLEQALADAGLSAHEEVCLKTLHVPFTLSLRAADGALERSFAEAVAKAVTRALSDPVVSVRYPHRAAALWDFALRTAAGDRTRDWAFLQLGLLTEADAAGGFERRVEAVLLALARAPESAPPVLHAWVQARQAARVLGAVPAPALKALAVALLRARSVPDVAAARLLERSQPAPVGPAPSVAALPLVQPWQAEVAAASGMARRLLIVSALALHEPWRLARADEVLFAWVDAWEQDAAAPPVPARDVEAARERPRTMASRTVSANEEDASDARAPQRHGAEVKDPAAPSSPVDAREERAKPADRASPLRPGDVEALWGDLRAVGHTSFGGLLFLAPLLPASGALEVLAEAFDPEVRPWRTVLHALSQRLCPAAKDDPAHLAFAGLMPDAPPPKVEPLFRDAELQALDAAAQRVRDHLCQRLGEQGAPVPHTLVRTAQVCAREADIRAEPGWFDVCLRLSEVDLSVRRAGLDLDPGFLRHLGVVVRFLYA